MSAEPCRIPLGNGRFALVDPEDFERISRHTWHLKRTRDPGRFYAQRTVSLGGGKKTAVLMHREILGVTDPKVFVDHKFGCGIDNRRENLRITNCRNNSSNVVSSKHRKAGGFKGVHWHKKAGKWEAAIGAGEVKPNGKRRRLYLGLFSDPADAARAYDAAALKHFGEYAALNFSAPALEPASNDAEAAASGGRL